MPGKYKALLSVGDKKVEQEFEIIKDPRLPNTQEDYENQFDFLITLRDKVSEAHEAIIEIRTIKKDLQYIKEKLGDLDKYASIIEKMGEFEKELTTIENNIHQTKNQSYQDPLNFGIKVNNHLSFLLGDQQRGDFPPTEQAKTVRGELETTLNQELKNLDDLVEKDLININNLLSAQGIQMLSSSKKPMKP